MKNFLISGHLSVGVENGLLIRELSALTGLKSREVRRQIQLERLRGIPILSDCKCGYYLAGSDEEITRFAVNPTRISAGRIYVILWTKCPGLTLRIAATRQTTNRQSQYKAWETA